MRENISNDITSWLINLPIVDSTNNYAMQLIQDGLAYHGMVVTTMEQTNGKGQRGKTWLSRPRENVIMSIVIDPQSYMDVYWLSFMLPIAVCKAIQTVVPECQINIKWPNDIYVGKQKIAGILIENVFRGSTIKHTVVGVGINANQVDFEPMERTPISLYNILGYKVDIISVISAVRESILLHAKITEFELLIKLYNDLLSFRKQIITLKKESQESIDVEIVGVNEQFQLVAKNVLTDKVEKYDFGTVQMIF